MKRLFILFLFLTIFTSVNKAQSLYCGGICISSISVAPIADSVQIGIPTDSIISISGLDTTYYLKLITYHWMLINMFGIHDSSYINYPVIIVVDSASGDTIGNPMLQSYTFYQWADSIAVDSVPTLLDSVSYNFKGYVLLIDSYYHDTCPYPYPMNCTNTGIREQAAIKTLMTVYPNPASAEINISINNMQQQSAIISLYDDTGQLVKTYFTANNLLTINRGGLSNGIYFITADIGNERLKSKLVIE